MRQAMVCILALLVATGATAQVDPVANARALAIAGQRTTALRILEMQLLQNPNDDDARTLYGTMLSWEGRFDEARQELRTVLVHDPRNLDARLALVNVELWSRHQRDAEQSLVTIGANYDGYEGLDAWEEAFVEVKRGTRLGAVVARAAHARRFGSDDDQLEIQWYPRLGSRSYADLEIAYAPDAVLYPRTRLNAELYRTLGRGFEASVGVSRLDFRETGATNVYIGSLGKYVGNWLLGGRVYASDADTAAQVLTRRFFGEHGQYVEIRFGKGTTRDAIRSATDIESLDVRQIAVEALLAPGRHWMLKLRAGAGRTSQSQDRFSVSAALGWRF